LDHILYECRITTRFELQFLQPFEIGVICKTSGKKAGTAHIDPNVVVFPQISSEIRVSTITKEFA